MERISNIGYVLGLRTCKIRNRYNKWTIGQYLERITEDHYKIYLKINYLKVEIYKIGRFMGLSTFTFKKVDDIITITEK
jgi:hypothetical protein